MHGFVSNGDAGSRGSSTSCRTDNPTEIARADDPGDCRACGVPNDPPLTFLRHHVLAMASASGESTPARYSNAGLRSWPTRTPEGPAIEALPRPVFPIHQINDGENDVERVDQLGNGRSRRNR
jgi:hypothetical protein